MRIRFVVYLLGLAALVLSPFAGSVELSPAKLLEADSMQRVLFVSIRLPHTFLAFFSGFILALGGLVFQSLFRNNLVTPYTLGVSSGAVLGAGIALRLGMSGVLFGLSFVYLFGFLGAFLSVLLVLYLYGFLRQADTGTLLLLGIALSLFYTAALMVLFYLGDSLQNDMILRYSMGSLSVVGWEEPLKAGAVGLFFLFVVYILRYELGFMAVSQEMAHQRGVDVKRVTIWLLLASSLAVGVLISITGPIGFVGLVVPHMVQRLHRVGVHKRIFQTAFFGGVFLVVCDLVARLLQPQSELPIGIVTALVGVPFFIYLILRGKKS